MKFLNFVFFFFFWNFHFTPEKAGKRMRQRPGDSFKNFLVCAYLDSRESDSFDRFEARKRSPNVWQNS